jgi:hypothetical protein
MGSRVDNRIIGNPWHLRFISPIQSDNLVQDAIKLVDYLDRYPVILVTLQWGLKKSSENHAIGMPMALLNYIKKNNKDIIWWLRIHPVQFQGKERKAILRKLSTEFAGYSNVLWMKPSEFPIPILLKGVNLHITIHSATTIEAAWFGIKTALLHPSPYLMHEYFKEQLESKMAQIVSASETDIKHWVDSELKGSKNINPVPSFNASLLKEFISDIKSGRYIKNI